MTDAAPNTPDDYRHERPDDEPDLSYDDPRANPGAYLKQRAMPAAQSMPATTEESTSWH